MLFESDWMLKTSSQTPTHMSQCSIIEACRSIARVYPLRNPKAFNLNITYILYGVDTRRPASMYVHLGCLHTMWGRFHYVRNNSFPPLQCFKPSPLLPAVTLFPEETVSIFKFGRSDSVLEPVNCQKPSLFPSPPLPISPPDLFLKLSNYTTFRKYHIHKMDQSPKFWLKGGRGGRWVDRRRIAGGEGGAISRVWRTGSHC